MTRIDETPVFSTKDIIDAYNNYDASPEAKDPILYFMSELLDMSIDALLPYTK